MTNDASLSTGNAERRRLGGVALLLPLLLGAAPSSPETPSLAEIRAAVETTVASMPAFSIRYSMRNELHEEPDEQADPGLKEGISEWGPKRYLWMKSGERVSATEFDGAGQPLVTVSFDGQKAYHLFRPVSQATIRITPQILDGYATRSNPRYLIALSVPQAAGTLAEVLRHPTATVAGSESIGEAWCHRVEAHDLPDVSGEATVHLTMWLDPSRDMLPRRLLAVFDSTSSWFRTLKPQEQELCRPLRYRWETIDFVQIPNPVRGSAGWFPKKAFFYQPWCRQELMIEEAIIHASLPSSQFRPPSPPGTMIRDETQAKPVNSIVGGRKALTKAVNTAAAQTEAIAAQGPPGAVDATPNRGLPWTSIFFWGSGGALVAATVVWFRRRS